MLQFKGEDCRNRILTLPVVAGGVVDSRSTNDRHAIDKRSTYDRQTIDKIIFLIFVAHREKGKGEIFRMGLLK